MSPDENILRVAVEPDGSKRADKEIFVKLCDDNIASHCHCHNNNQSNMTNTYLAGSLAV